MTIDVDVLSVVYPVRVVYGDVSTEVTVVVAETVRLAVMVALM